MGIKTSCFHLTYTILGFAHYYVTIEERYKTNATRNLHCHLYCSRYRIEKIQRQQRHMDYMEWPKTVAIFLKYKYFLFIFNFQSRNTLRKIHSIMSLFVALNVQKCCTVNHNLFAMTANILTLTQQTSHNQLFVSSIHLQ